MTKKLLFLIVLICTVQGLFAFTIYIKTPAGNIIDIETESSDSFEQITEKIKQVTGYPNGNQILAFNGEVVLYGKTLADYGVSSGSYLQLIISANPAPTTDHILYINQNAPASSNQDGSSWDNAITDLSSALLWIRLQEHTGTVTWTHESPLKIYIAEGTYYPVYSAHDAFYIEPGLQNSAFVLGENVQLIGGFPGTGNPVFNDRNWSAYPTILSGDPLTPSDNTDNAFHVVIAVGTSDSAMLMGLNISDGIAGYGTMDVNGAFIERSQGGGMVNINASPTLKDVVFRNNQATGTKGPNGSEEFIHGLGGTPAYGGGMYNANANPVLINVAFIENKVIGGDGGDGKTGLDGEDAPSPTDNGSNGGNGGNGGVAANGFGGGMYNNGASPTLINVVFSKNIAVGGQGGSGGDGGNGGDASTNGGEGGYGGNGGNGGNGMGAGMYSSGIGTIKVINATFNANQSIGGLSGKIGSGGMGGQATLPGHSGPSGIGGSEGQAYGGGLCVTDGANAVIQNSIVFDNSATIDPEINITGASVNIAYSYLKGNGSWETTWGTDGGNNIISSTQPFLDAGAQDLSLAAGSLAINAGDNSFIPSEVTIDIAGHERISDGTIDIGAYEFGDNTVPVQLRFFRAFQQKKKVHLTWETVTELNNDHFIVSRSNNGIDYKRLALVTGQGTTTHPHNYSVDDVHPYDGLNYYQLQEVNKNGKINTLKTITINILSEANKPIVYPNPARNQLHIVLKEKGVIKIYDPAAKTVMEFSGKAGDNQVDITGLSSGIYFIQIKGNSTPLKFIKQ